MGQSFTKLLTNCTASSLSLAAPAVAIPFSKVVSFIELFPWSIISLITPAKVVTILPRNCVLLSFLYQIVILYPQKTYFVVLSSQFVSRIY